MRAGMSSFTPCVSVPVSAEVSVTQSSKSAARISRGYPTFSTEPIPMIKIAFA
jgi:hypothetical protein